MKVRELLLMSTFLASASQVATAGSIVSPASATVGEEVLFEFFYDFTDQIAAMGYNVFDGVIDFAWVTFDYGDVTPPSFGPVPAQASGSFTFAHTYALPGGFPVVADIIATFTPDVFEVSVIYCPVESTEEYYLVGSCECPSNETFTLSTEYPCEPPNGGEPFQVFDAADGFITISEPPAVPLPASLPLLIAGVGGLAFMRRRSRAS